MWSFPAADSAIELEESDGQFMPNIAITAALPADSALRTQGAVPGVFVEQRPFARQRLVARWKPALGSDADPAAQAVLSGYVLQAVELESTPLTALANMLALLQAGDANQAQRYTTRVDVAAEAARLGMVAPGDWIAVYVNEQDREIQDDRTSLRIRFFDNADRNRSFEALFEQDPATGQYRVASVAPVVLASSAGLVTPAPPRPTPTVVPTGAALVATPQLLGLSGAVYVDDSADRHLGRSERR